MLITVEAAAAAACSVSNRIVPSAYISIEIEINNDLFGFCKD